VELEGSPYCDNKPIITNAMQKKAYAQQLRQSSDVVYHNTDVIMPKSKEKLSKKRLLVQGKTVSTQKTHLLTKWKYLFIEILNHQLFQALDNHNKQDFFAHDNCVSAHNHSFHIRPRFSCHKFYIERWAYTSRKDCEKETKKLYAFS
jgi:microcompartment protein CcmK/EutM